MKEIVGVVVVVVIFVVVVVVCLFVCLFVLQHFSPSGAQAFAMRLTLAL
jgi:hypothetical protein